MVNESEGAPPPKVTALPLTDAQRLRAKQAARRTKTAPSRTQRKLGELGQLASNGLFGIPKAAYFGASAACAANALLRRSDVHDWVAAAVLLALGIL
jgi:hypothetical protein